MAQGDQDVDSRNAGQSRAPLSRKVSRRSDFLTSSRGVLLFALISCFLWGSAFPCIKVGNALFGIASADTSSQLLFAGVRFVIAGLMVVLAMSVLRGRPLVPKRSDWGAILLLSLFQTILQYGLFYPGVSRASSLASSIIEGSNSFVTILLACLVFRQERLTSRKVAGCIVGFAGVVLMALRGAGASSDAQAALGFFGELLVFLSTIAAAASSCTIKQLSVEHDPVLLSAYQFVVGGVVLAMLGLAGGGSLHPAGAPAIALLAYMGFISAAAYTLWSMLLSVNPASRVSVFGFMNPVFGAILSALLLGEGSSVEPWRAIGALALVSLGIVIVNRAPKAAQTATTIEN